MEIRKIIEEKDKIKAVKYVYDKAIPSKFSYDIFESLVLNNSSDSLPEFYVLKEKGEYIGYLLLFADEMKNIPKPFTFLSLHNGDELLYSEHCDLLKFIIERSKKKKYTTLEKLASHELLLMQNATE